MTFSSNSAPTTDTLLETLEVSSVDRILIYLALSVLQSGSHRYGAFLEASTTAAKLAVYASYLQQGKNVRRTGFLHHIEPKRVRVIVREMENLTRSGRLITTLGEQEPYYLSGLPYLWLTLHPWAGNCSRLQRTDLTPRELRAMDALVPAHYPPARLLDLLQFTELIKTLYTRSQEDVSPESRLDLSEALVEHIKFRLIDSGTVTQLMGPDLSIPVYALARSDYAPRGRQARAFTMVDDVARFFRLMQAWTAESGDETLRALEVFDVDPAQRTEALKELDTLLRQWADRYHQDGGHPMVMQMAAGTRAGLDG